MVLSLTTLETLRTTVADWRKAGQRIGFVPTMGALHQGHATLMREARQNMDRLVVSIFVNPTQFGPNEDFSRYPRPLEKDLALLQEEGVDAVWLPTPELMYPTGFSTSIRVSPMNEWLCGAFRPGHFDGVATVVAKLFHQVSPDAAFFGEKDYQQLCILRRMAADLNIPVMIQGVPTVRESDGLALSSRNQYLSAEERALAPTLYRILSDTRAAIRNGANVADTLANGKAAILAAGFRRVDYLELRDAQSLSPLSHYHAPARLLAAAHLGTTRLIDNVEV